MVNNEDLIVSSRFIDNADDRVPVGCSRDFHRRSRWGSDHLEVKPERIALIEPGRTTRKEIFQILDRPAWQQMTFRQPFLVTYQGKRYRIDQKMTFHYTIYTPPEHTPTISVYSWYEQRGVTVYLNNDIVQIVLTYQTFNQPRHKGPLTNHEETLYDKERMNGFGCAREIFEVVSLGRHPSNESEYYRFCEPLILKPIDPP